MTMTPEQQNIVDEAMNLLIALFAKGMHFPCVIIETVIESTTNDRIREISTMDHKKYQSWGSEIDELSPPQKEQTQNLLSGVTDENASLMVIEARLNETRQCPHCKASGAVSKGMNRGLRRYLCKDCNKTFNAATGTALQGLHNKDKCLTFGNCLTEGMMVRKAAEHCDFAVSTSFRWRHRFLAKVPHFPAKNRRFCRFGVGKILILLMWNPGFSM